MKNSVPTLCAIKVIDKLLSLLSITFLLLLILGFGSAEIAIITVLSAVLHELGHIFASLLFTTKCKIRFQLFSPRLLPQRLLSYKKTLVVALSGPLVNLLIFAIFISISEASGDIFYNIGVINALTAISNLMPVKGYDGYRIIHSIVSNTRFQRLGRIILDLISDALSVIICFFSLFLMLNLNTGYWSYIIFFSNMSKSVIGSKKIKMWENKRKREF